MKEIIHKLIKFQTKITPSTDKIAHFFWGFWYAQAGLILDKIININFLVLFIPLFFGAYKEIKDYLDEDGTPEWKDLVYTILAGLVILIYNI